MASVSATAQGMGREVTKAEVHAREFLRLAVGVDCVGDLERTPYRMARAIAEMTSGYAVDPAKLLSTTFDVEFDELVMVRNVRFTSMCEHHILPFVGFAHVGYVPGKKVVGLSKLARLVMAFAMRLQVQERMTRQIADAIQQHLEPQGVAVIVKARHSCMGHRGARQPGAEMITSAMVGCFRDDSSARAEFMRLAGDEEG